MNDTLFNGDSDDVYAEIDSRIDRRSAIFKDEPIPDILENLSAIVCYIADHCDEHYGLVLLLRIIQDTLATTSKKAMNINGCPCGMRGCGDAGIR